MKRTAALFLLSISIATPALSDACSDLINQAEAGLSMTPVDEASRVQFQQWLDTGKSGDPLRCEAAITASAPASSPAAGASEHGCARKTPDSV
jgi:hypothetical protein